MRIGGCKVLAQPLCARLANMKRRPDGTYRGNAISCEFSSEHRRGVLSKRIGHGRVIMWASGRARHQSLTGDLRQPRGDLRLVRCCGAGASLGGGETGVPATSR